MVSESPPPIPTQKRKGKEAMYVADVNAAEGWKLLHPAAIKGRFSAAINPLHRLFIDLHLWNQLSPSPKVYEDLLCVPHIYLEKKSLHHRYSLFVSHPQSGQVCWRCQTVQCHLQTSRPCPHHTRKLFAYRENRTGEVTVPSGAPVDVSITGGLLIPTNCSLLRRKSNIQRII